MSDILSDLRDADARGISPPQNWTTRAAATIEALQAEVERLQVAEIKRTKEHITTQHERALFRERAQAAEAGAAALLGLIQRAMEHGVNGSDGYDAAKATDLGHEMRAALAYREESNAV